jgi:predicted acyl esterase
VRSRVTTALLTLAAIGGLLAGAAPTRAQAPQAQAAAAPRNDADSTEYYFNSPDGVTTLHADVLRPKGMAATVKTPVILTVSPYTNRNGQTIDVDPTGTGPSSRFNDFLDLSGVLTKGYTYVMVDLPGFGGSGGCNDWGGVREQQATRAAVEWAASQPWSTGKVALLGKSYDGWTGLMGIASQPAGLAAVVSLEPVYSGYRYLWMNGIRHPLNWPATIAEFQAFDAKPGRPAEAIYNVNSAPQAWCYGVNIGGSTADDSESGPYWAERNLLPTTVGRTTPLFLTQGFLEANTLSDAAFQYFNGLAGTQNRAWFGQWDHCRPWETSAVCGGAGGGGGNRLAVGRPGFIDEVLRFLDLHLKGIQPVLQDAGVQVQDIQGRFRNEASWPPADSQLYTTDLRTGTFTDTGSGGGTRPSATGGIWTVSKPLDHDVWLAGEPVVTVGVDAVPNANVAANVYDIDGGGKARMISRGVSLLRGIGQRSVTYTMFGQDWPIAAGHRIGVLVTSGDSDLWQAVPTQSTVTVRNAKIALPFLTYDRIDFIEGEPTPKLEGFMSSAATVLPAATITAAERAFTLPAPLSTPPSGH